MHIYFFTGTGNSYRTAQKLKELSVANGHLSLLTPVDGLKRKDIKPAPEDHLFAFFYPTHGFSLPWHMLKFICRFPSGKGKVALVNNRAGMKMGRLFTPGLSGIALLLPMIILLIKGYRIAAMVPLDTPSNWISIHPGIRKKVVSSIFLQRENEIAHMWACLKKGKGYYPLKFFLLLPLDLLISPISLAYVFYGRFMLARTYLADHKCNGCGLCADRCPVGAIKMIRKQPYWTYRCESCMRCANICPEKAINSSIPLTVLYTWLFIKIIAIDGPLKFIWDHLEGLGNAPFFLIKYMILWVLTFLGSLLLYQLFYSLNRIKVFKYIFAFTTPMKFWRHYIAPGFKGKY